MTPAASNTVLVTVANRIATITLNRPAQYNALSRELRSAFTAALVALNTDEAVDVLIVTGAGDKAFSTGADLKELLIPTLLSSRTQDG